MNENEFMGYFIGAVAVLVSIVFTILNYASNRKDKSSKKNLELEKRFDDLNGSINELSVTMKLLTKSVETLNEKIDSNIKSEAELEKKVQQHEVTLSNHETRIGMLEDNN